MPKVKVYSTNICPYCVAVKEFLKSHNIEFEEVDVSENLEAQKEMVEKSGQMGAPVVEIGDEIIIGFDKVRITKLLKIKE